MRKLARLVLIVGAVAAAGFSILFSLSGPRVQRGSSAVEFAPAAVASPPPRRALRTLAWPTFGFDPARTKAAASGHRPPFRKAWSFDALDTLEFPPGVGYGKVFQAQQRGRFFALDARSGNVAWQKRLGRCSASSPTIAAGVVYQSWMGTIPCTQRRHDPDGFLVAWRARDGKELWRFRAKPIESSPLLQHGTLYVASWDHRVYAIDAQSGRERWRFEGDDQLNSSPAYSRGTIYIGSNAGSLYALDARTGALRWRARSHSRLGRREEFYATPAVAYGRVYIGNVDGTVAAYGARTGRLLWRRPIGPYVYSSAAVWAGAVYVGSYDGHLYALDAATGDVRWRGESSSAVHSAPVVMGGLVYYASCGSCGRLARRPVKRGHDGTYARDALTGRLVWHSRTGKYASPVVADGKHVFLVGRARLVALLPVTGSRAGRR